jgi:hypothetical protein
VLSFDERRRFFWKFSNPDLGHEGELELERASNPPGKKFTCDLHLSASIARSRCAELPWISTRVELRRPPMRNLSQDFDAKNMTEPARADPRKFERAKVTFRGKILDATGTPICDCTICDLSIVGAKVKLDSSQPIPEQFYLLDITNEIAYDARTAWWRPELAGLAFQKILELGESLPEHLEFLNLAILDAKFEHVEQLTAQGVSLIDAVRLAGMTEESYARGSAEKSGKNSLVETICRLEAENAALRKLLNEASKPATSS